MYSWKEIEGQLELIPVQFTCNATLKEDNIWVRLANVIPWSDLEARYAKTFSTVKRGRPGINARIALGALIIQALLNTTDEMTVAHIEQNPYLQYFLGLESYTTEPIIESSLLTRIRQRISAEDWQAINELVVDRFKKVEKARKKTKKGVPRAESGELFSKKMPQEQLILDVTRVPSDIAYSTDLELKEEGGKKEEKDEPRAESEEPRSEEQPQGQLILDATCVPSDIAYPTDLELKEESREKTKKDEPRAESEELRSAEQPRGQLILDATCVPSDIAYPTDLDLLNQAREKAEKILDELYAPGKRIQGEKKPRTYRQKARRDYLRVAKKPKARKKEIRKAVGKQLNYLRRDLQHIENRITQSGGWPLPPVRAKELEVIKQVYAQQKQMYETKSRTCAQRIVSLSQPHVRPIKRGKKKQPTEFGAKVAISLTEGYVQIDRLSWENFNESTLLQESVERYREQNGYYPEAVLVDKLYRTRENIRYCQERGIRISGPRLGRPRAESKEEKRMARQDARSRNPVEGKFGEAKRRYSWGLNKGKLRETGEANIYLTAITMNIARFLRGYFFIFFRLLGKGEKTAYFGPFFLLNPFLS
ncbi:MAG TPA: IS5 family transposase [Thermotogota bacterium]|jgi:hypothetical protein|nr:MAG: hypothetical protein BWX67_02109 [Thermotogota bacterium ADurb.Bin062]HOF24509.1 IS5 family transposase [Thermotogota bacterium]HOS25808.1 IS5 family transposase [Thermotogota bacterium]HOT87704.1 IS5 family transposase [Thermotogota bacterium]HPD36659.1 IS5 family transposase [Thermotogota bacterium]